MDFLRYLDVIIALAVVMVLLSPIVTAVTHAAMWLTNGRSTFLLQALQRLLVQVEGNPPAVLEVQDAAGRPVAGTQIAWPSVLPPSATTNALGQIAIPTGIPDAAVPHGQLTLKGTGLTSAHRVTVRRVPQPSLDNLRVISPPTDAQGKTKTAYRFEGPRILASREAHVRVTSGGRPLAATLTSSIEASPGVTIAVPANGAATWTYPEDMAPSSAFEIEWTIVPDVGPLDGLVVEAEFVRNPQFDYSLAPGRIASDGTVSLPSMSLTLAQAVVRHPMVARTQLRGPWPKVPPVKNRTAEVVEREELIRILLELAAGESATSHLDDDSRRALQALLAANGIPNAADALSKVRSHSQQLENTHPELASHVRNSRAIIQAIESDFVGKINHWFDAAMARATQQYAATARAWTVVGALIVSVALQFNSLELLQRLSTDSSLRESLLDMAQREQERIERLTLATAPTAAAGAPAAGATPATTPGATAGGGAQGSAPAQDARDHIAFAQARGQELERQLAALRAPELSIVPDHFVWQATPRARLTFNPLWAGSYPTRLELLAGGQSWQVQPGWRRNPLSELKDAIDASGAPVATTIESGVDYLLIAARQPLDVHLLVGDAAIAMEPLLDVAEGEVWFRRDWPPTISLQGQPMRLIVDGRATALPAGTAGTSDTSVTRDELLPRLATLVPQALPTLATQLRCEDARGRVADCTAGNVRRLLALRARSPHIRDMQILWNANDPFSNLLNDVRRRPHIWRVSSSALGATESKMIKLLAYDRHTDHDDDLQAVPDRSALTFTVAGTGGAAQQVAEAMSAAIRTLDEGGEAAATAFAGLTARYYRADELVVTGRRMGPLELRHTPGGADSDVFNGHREQARIAREHAANFLAAPFDTFGPEIFGVFLSWALLSLGAPFWFDMLKNALKLRPAAASTEERNRQERVQHTERKA